MNGLALCAGVGGLELSLSLIIPTYRTVCYVEREAFAAATLVARMDEGWLDPAPVWDDVESFDGRRWRGYVDIVSAGFPCQPWSAAGLGLGVEDERWIWPIIAERLREIRPGLVWLENVPALVARGGLGHVLGPLAEIGLDAQWDVFRAADVRASHRRERLFILAYNDRGRLALERSAHHDNGRDAFRHADGCDPEILAHTHGGTLRIEPERNQWDRRRERATECEHAEPGTDVPCFSARTC